uniref:Uncharacterized protein n=1 Tax=Romanomermis culicivorax TaxID=13658 RepID=A0A915KBV9_ROMCU
MKVYQECLSFKIGILNRNAHLTDRYFILCHVLRCPQEMGEWSKKFIQPLPQSDSLFDRSLVMNHFLTLLRIVLEPIKNRKNYLHDYLKNTVSDNSWVIVDVDG